MNLAFLTHEPFYPPSGGGSAEAVYLIQELTGRGHEVHVFGPALEDPAAVQRKFGIVLHEFKTWPMGRYTPLRNFKYLLYPFFLQRLVEGVARRVKFDLVLSQHAIAAVTAGRLKPRLRLPVVMNFLDYLTGFLETWPAYLAPRGLIRAMKRFELSLPGKHQVDAIMTVSDTLADYFADAGFPRDRILPIYYGYDSQLFSRPDPPLASGAPASPTVVMHGSFDHHHLGPIARNAVAVVVQAQPEAVFRLVGKRTPALDGFVRYLRQHVPQARVECTGFIPYDQVARHLATATIGMVPYEESTGTHCAFVAKIVEYLGMGLPVVSTPLNSAQRYFHNEPLVRFATFDGLSFGRKILTWLQEPLATRQALARAAGRRVKAELDWRVICRKAIDFVEKIYRQNQP